MEYIFKAFTNELIEPLESQVNAYLENHKGYNHNINCIENQGGFLIAFIDSSRDNTQINKLIDAKISQLREEILRLEADKN